MIPLSETQQKVRSFLIEMIRDPKYAYGRIFYQQLSNACNLGFNMVLDSDRQAIGKLLCDISEFEHENDRPLLSAVVVLAEPKTDRLQGDGFFELCDKLDVRELSLLKYDKRFSNAMINRCQVFWRNDENHNAYK